MVKATAHVRSAQSGIWSVKKSDLQSLPHLKKIAARIYFSLRAVYLERYVHSFFFPR
jgi:hypothetical protein